MGQFSSSESPIAFPVSALRDADRVVLVNLAPGDPVTAMINPVTRAELGPDWVKERQAAAWTRQPVVFRYGIWLKELVQGNLGYSMDRRPAGCSTRSRRASARPLLLMGTAMLLGTMIGIPLGIFSALRQYSLLDYVTTVFGFSAISTPSFFLGLALMYIFAVHLANGSRPPACARSASRIRRRRDLIQHMIMPVTVLTLAHTPLVMRYARASMLEIAPPGFRHHRAGQGAERTCRH